MTCVVCSVHSQINLPSLLICHPWPVLRPFRSVPLNSSLCFSLYINLSLFLMQWFWYLTAIATKSPLAIIGTKTVLLKSRDLTVDQGLDYVATMNSARLLSNDLTEAVTAQLQKRKPVFSKLWLCWGEMVWLFLCIFGIQLFEDHYYKSLQYWTNNKRFACFYSSIAAYGTLRN